MEWTTEQVLALAPDASAAKSGKDLSIPRKWKTLGANSACAWGSIQGSGETPYQTSIDFSGPAFKCSCPSRKFPCKHSLALLLIVAQQPSALSEKEPAPWTVEWLAKRSEKEEKKATKQAKASEPRDSEAEAKAAVSVEKRAAARDAKVSAGLIELKVWLSDLVRTGFASLPGKPSSFWTVPAARLFDAQVPGLARRVGSLDGITASGDHWPSRLLRSCAILHLASEAWVRVPELLPEVQADLRATLGFTANQDDVLCVSGIEDQWLVLGNRVETDERLRVQRTWLFGIDSKRLALCLSFSAGPNQPLDVTLPPGALIDAELVYFPSAWPMRALVKQRNGMKAGFGSPPPLPPRNRR
jgi:hypothetical protein